MVVLVADDPQHWTGHSPARPTSLRRALHVALASLLGALGAPGPRGQPPLPPRWRRTSSSVPVDSLEYRAAATRYDDVHRGRWPTRSRSPPTAPAELDRLHDRGRPAHRRRSRRRRPRRSRQPWTSLRPGRRLRALAVATYAHAGDSTTEPPRREDLDSSIRLLAAPRPRRRGEHEPVRRARRGARHARRGCRTA